MRVLFLCARVHVGAGAGAAWAQPGATGPVATLNAEAKSLSETDPDRSLAPAQEALAAAREVQDVRGRAQGNDRAVYDHRVQHQAARDVMFKQEHVARRGRAQRRPVHSQHLPVVL